MKRIYTAGPFSWQQRILSYANLLASLGFEITGEWLTQEGTFTNPDNTTNIKKPGLHSDCERLSIRDLANIADSDTLILFEPGTAIERNTRVAEFGAALAWGLQCIVIQPPDEDKKDVISNIFVKLQSKPGNWWENERLHKIKPVLEFRTFADLYEEIIHAQPVECCAGCGHAYDERDCGCPAGSFKRWRTPNAKLYVPAQDVPLLSVK